MEHKELEEHFCRKISEELTRFKHQILRKKKKEIFDAAYQIDYIVRIYEILMEISSKLGAQQLHICLHISGLLTFLYEEWLKIPDSQREEEESAVWLLLEQTEQNMMWLGGA